MVEVVVVLEGDDDEKVVGRVMVELQKGRQTRCEGESGKGLQIVLRWLQISCK